MYFRRIKFFCVFMFFGSLFLAALNGGTVFGSTPSEPATPQKLIIKAPDPRSLDPNSFPTMSFQIFNDSFEECPAQCEVLLPTGWTLLSRKIPLVFLPQTSHYARLTLGVPPDVRADSFYRVGLAVRWKSGSETVWTSLTIREKRAVRLLSFSQEAQAVPGHVQSQDYVFANMGNVTDTLFLTADLPSGWDIVNLDERLVIPPQSKAVAGLSYRVPDTFFPGSRVSVILRATLALDPAALESGTWTDTLSFVPQEKTILDMLIGSVETARRAAEMFQGSGRVLTMNERGQSMATNTWIRVLPPEKKRSSLSLHPVLPISIGFSMDRYEKGLSPQSAFHVKTDTVNLGGSSFQMEWTQRADRTPAGQPVHPVLERFRMELTGPGWNLLAGDASLTANPLLAWRSSLTHNDLATYDEIGRGFQTGYSGEKNGFSFFRGKRIFAGDSFTLVSARSSVSKSLTVLTSFMDRDSSKFVTAETKISGTGKWTFGFLGGLSGLWDNTPGLGRAGQARAEWKSDHAQMTGCLHWADSRFDGVDQGQTGAALFAHFWWSRVLTLWTNAHVYSADPSMWTYSSPAKGLFFRSHAMINPKGFPVLVVGYEQSSLQYTEGFRSNLIKADVQVQKNLRFGIPLLRYRIDDRLASDYRTVQRWSEWEGEWSSYFRSLRLKVEKRWLRTGDSPLGSLNTVEVDFRFMGQSIGFFLTKGNVWTENWNRSFRETAVNAMGIRSRFGVRPFGKEYAIGLDIGKYASEWEDFQGRWSISLSLSAGVHPDVPVPFVKTLGRIRGDIFVDKNGNRMRDRGEPGIPQVAVVFAGKTEFTDPNGRFECEPVAEGEYPFFLDGSSLPAYVNLTDEAPKTMFVHRGVVAEVPIPVSSVCGFQGVLFLDADGDGRQGSEETGLARIRLLVSDRKGREWEVYTEDNGFFDATDLLPGVYTVRPDPDWLPERVVPAERESFIVLSTDSPRGTLAVPVKRKVIEIRKTFTAPK